MVNSSGFPPSILNRCSKSLCHSVVFKMPAFNLSSLLPIFKFAPWIHGEVLSRILSITLQLTTELVENV